MRNVTAQRGESCCISQREVEMQTGRIGERIWGGGGVWSEDDLIIRVGLAAART